jgi:hypothetical protein
MSDRSDGMRVAQPQPDLDVQQAPERNRRKEAAKPEPGQSTNVYSLATARLRRSRTRTPAQEKPLPPELTGLDLRGVELERMTRSAREHFWFNMNRYARQLFGTANELCIAQTGQPTAAVTAQHVRTAELQRMRRLHRRERADLGLIFVLDALQIIGAAVCGALATKPDLIGDGGALPLAAALVITVSIFLTRETLATRTA